MGFSMDRDGKLLDRVIGAAIPIAIGMAVTGVVWWKDTSNATVRAAENLTRLEIRIDKLEKDTSEIRNTAAEDRRKTAEIAVNLNNMARGISRIEGILDKWSGYKFNSTE